MSRRYRRPDKARTRRLLVRYHKHGDQNARERVIQEQLPLAEFLARKFSGRGEPLDDLIQVASVGLIKAVDRFDVDRKIEFSTYATPNILGEIKRYFRDKGWAIRVPRRLAMVWLVDDAGAVRPEHAGDYEVVGRRPAGPEQAAADLADAYANRAPQPL